MRAIGMNLPIRNGQLGYFEQTFDSFSNERVKLINLMKTYEGERYMQPSFGLAINKYLFQPINEELKNKIQLEIERKVEFWLPNIVINEMRIDISTDVDRNIVSVYINFSMVNNPDKYDVVTFVF